MNQIKTIAQYELYSVKGEVPSRLSHWIEGVYRQFMLSNGAHVRLANIKVNQQVDLMGIAESGVTFSFTAKQFLGVEMPHSEPVCPDCSRKKNQLAQAALVSQHQKRGARLHANQHITCMQLYVPFTRVKQMVALEGLNLKRPWFSAIDDDMSRVPRKEVLSIHVDRQIAQAINAIYKSGLDLLNNDVGQVQVLSEALLQRLIRQLHQRYVGPAVCKKKDAAPSQIYADLSVFGHASSTVIH
ncbi:hypothetical protein [Alkalimarinus coralli]|uniref:hypothetical protein n=1 Tax=Alkalimarinus coralli TaxID=2935863 RepID=UPI00202B75B0|nr:hypothetical protein [Alkalimarinus coralli]